MSTIGPTTSRAGFRQALTPLGASRKRKDRDAPLDAPPRAAAGAAVAVSPRPPLPKPKAEPMKPKPSDSSYSSSSSSSNNIMILAGYMAHEFLTGGTLLGECLDPTAAALREEEVGKEKVDTAACGGKASARLLMGESGARIPGIVNPTQLARWLHTKP